MRLASCPRPVDVSFCLDSMQYIYPHLPRPETDHVVVVCELIVDVTLSCCCDVEVVATRARQTEQSLLAWLAIDSSSLARAQITEIGVWVQKWPTLSFSAIRAPELNCCHISTIISFDH
jgi:hypothetical protein